MSADESSGTRKSAGPKESADVRWLHVVQKHARDLQHGVIHVVVHESRVTQVERIERVRFERTSHDYEI